MTGSDGSRGYRRFLRVTDPRGRDIVVWILISLPAAIRLAGGGGQTSGWRLWVDLLLLAAGLAGTVSAAVRLRRYRGTTAPEDCPTCGHTWSEHGDAAETCEGCALEIEYGVAPRVTGGCRVPRPVRSWQPARLAAHGPT